MPSHRIAQLSFVFGFMVTSFVASLDSQAATYTFDPNLSNGVNLGGSGAWNTGTGNWFNGAADTTWGNGADTAVFSGNGGGSAPFTVTVDAGGINFNSLNFLTDGYKIGGGAMTLVGTGNTISVGSGITAAISSVIGDGGGALGFTKAGNGTLVLSGQNTYTGATTLNGGVVTLDFSAAGAPGSNILTSASVIKLNGGAMSIVGGAGATSQNFAGVNALFGGKTMTFTAGAGGLGVGLGAITRTSGTILNLATSGTVTLTTSNTNAAFGALGGGYFLNGDDFAKATAGVISAFGNGTLLPTGGITSANTTTTTIYDDHGANANRFTAANNFLSGSVTIGGLKFNNTGGGAAVLSLSTNTLTINDGTGVGAIIVASTDSNSSRTINAAAGGVLTAVNELIIQDNNTLIISAPIGTGNAMGLTVGGSGITTLSGLINITGALTVVGGTTVTVSGNPGSVGSITVVSGTLTAAGSTITSAGAIIIGGTGSAATFVGTNASRTLSGTTLTVNNGGVYTTAQSTSLSGAMTVNTGGVITFSGVSTATGLIINGGSMAVNTATVKQPGLTTVTPVTMNGGTLSFGVTGGAYGTFIAGGNNYLKLGTGATAFSNLGPNTTFSAVASLTVDLNGNAIQDNMNFRASNSTLSFVSSAGAATLTYTQNSANTTASAVIFGQNVTFVPNPATPGGSSLLTNVGKVVLNGGSLSSNASTPYTVTVPIQVTAASSLSPVASSIYTLSSQLSGTAALNVAGAGIVQIKAASDNAGYTGAVSVNTGVLRIEGAASGVALGGAVNVGVGATLASTHFANNATISGLVTVASSGVLDIGASTAAAGSLAQSNSVLALPGGLSLTAAQINFVLNGAANSQIDLMGSALTTSGVSSINFAALSTTPGTYVLFKNFAGGDPTANFTLSTTPGGGTLSYDSTLHNLDYVIAAATAQNYLWNANAVAPGTTSVTAADGSATWINQDSVSHFVDATGTAVVWDNTAGNNVTFGTGSGAGGTVTLGSAELDVGTITFAVNSGTGYTISGDSTHTLSLASGIGVNNNATIDAPITLGKSEGTVTLSGGATLTLTSAISQASVGASLTATGSGTLRLGADSSGATGYSGGTVFGGGATVLVAGDANLGQSTGTLTFNNGTLQVSGTSFTSGRNITLNAGNGTISNSGNVALSGVVSGVGGLTLVGGATFNLSNTGSNYGGATTVSGSTLQITTATTPLGAATAGLALNNSTLTSNVTADLGPKPLTLAGTSDVIFVGAGATVTLSGGSSGAANLIKQGDGTLYFDAAIANTTGQLRLQGGTVTINANNGFNAAVGGVFFDASATFNNQATGTTWSSAISVSIDATSTATFQTGNNKNMTIAGVISSTSPSGGTLGKTGGGFLQLRNANTYAGGTVINNGTIFTFNASALGTGGVNFNGAGTLALSTSGLTIATLSGTAAGSIINDANTTAQALTLNGNGSYTYVGLLANNTATTGSLSLTLTPASGTLVLALTNGNSTYSGGTTLNSGASLAAMNATGTGAFGVGPIAVNNGATVGGTGNITAASSLTFATGSAFNQSAFSPSTVANLTASATTINGGTFNFRLGASSGVNDALSMTNLGVGGSANIAISLLSGVTTYTAGTYSVMPYSGTGTGLGSLTLTQPGSAPNFTFSLNTGSGSNSAVQVLVGMSQLTWTGTSGTAWDVNTTTNWTGTGGAATKFLNGNSVLFDNSGSPNTSVVIATGGVSPSAMTVNSSLNYTIDSTNGGITGTASLTKSGSGTLTLNDPNSLNSYTGGATLNGGTVQINSATGLGGASGAATINAATLEVLGSLGTINSSRNFFLGAATSAIKVDAGSTYSIGGTIADVSPSSTGTLNFTGPGTLVLTGNNTYTNGTVVNTGTLIVGNTSGSALGTGAVQVNNGATLASSVNTANIAGSVTIASGGHLSVGNGNIGTLGIGGDLTSTSGFFDYVLGATNTSSVINLAGTLNLNGVTLNLTGATAGDYTLINFGSDPTTSSFSSVAGLGSLSYTESIAGQSLVLHLFTPSALTGNLVWTNQQNNFTWDTTSVNWVDGTTAVSFSTGNTVTFTNVGAGTVNVSNGGNTVLPTAVTVTNSGTNTYTFTGDPIGGSATLTKLGNGTLVIANANSFTGTTSISDGIVSLTGSIASPTISVGGTLLVAASGALTGNTNNPTVTVAGGVITMSNSQGMVLLDAGAGGTVNLAATNTLTLNAGSSFGGTVAGTGNVQILGNATLSGSNSYAGTTFITGTQLHILANNTLPTTTTLSMSGAATFDMRSFNQQVRILESSSSNATVTGSGTLTVAPTAATTTTYAGAMTGAMSFAFSGVANSAEVISGTGNTYQGTTDINSGALIINGSLNSGGGLVTVGTGAALEGTGNGTTTGVVDRNVLVSNGGTIAPGDPSASVVNGALHIGGALSISGTYAWSLTAASTNGAGTNFDQISLNSTSTFAGAGGSLQLALAGAGVPDGTAFWQSGHTWAVISGFANGNALSLFTLNDPNAGSYSQYGSFVLESLANDNAAGAVLLDWAPTAVPEPGTLLLGTLVTMGLGGYQWRRRKARAVGSSLVVS